MTAASQQRGPGASTASARRWPAPSSPTTSSWVRSDHWPQVLLTGNHDRCWAGHRRRAEGWEERVLAAGFDEILNGEVVIAVGGHQALACHFPYRGDSYDRDPFVDSRPVDNGQWLLHGHVHERWLQRGRTINVGVDAWDYRPVSEARIAGAIHERPADRPPQRP